jgi:hypothetical protein
MDWPATGLVKLVVLFWREKLPAPAGIFPRAFSDMPCSCLGTSSSAAEATDEAADGLSLGLDAAGVGRASSSLSSSSSSSPIAKVLSSSGRSPSVGGARDRGAVGLLTLSIELLVELGSSGSREALLSFLRRLRRSISSWPLSSVKDRSASNRFLFRNMAKMN